MDAKVNLVNNISELNDSLQILIVLGNDKENPDFSKYSKRAYEILKEQYGAFSLYFNEIKHTIDVERLYSVLDEFGKYVLEQERTDFLFVYFDWVNVFGHNGFSRFSWLKVEDEVQQIPEPQQRPNVLNTERAKFIFESAIEKGLLIVDGDKYRWNDTASLYGYFVDKTSDFLDIRQSNNRIPWKTYEPIIINHSELLATARQAVNDYNNKGLSPPEGDDIVNDICK